MSKEKEETKQPDDAMSEKLRIAEELLAQKTAENEALVENQKKLIAPIKVQLDKALASAPDVVKAKFAGKEVDPVIALEDLTKELEAYDEIKAEAMAEVKQQVREYQDTIAKKYGTKLPELDKIVLDKPITHTTATEGKVREQPVKNDTLTVGDLATKPLVTYEEAKIITGRLSSMTAYLAAKKEAAVAAKK